MNIYFNYVFKYELIAGGRKMFTHLPQYTSKLAAEHLSWNDALVFLMEYAMMSLHIIRLKKTDVLITLVSIISVHTISGMSQAPGFNSHRMTI